MSNISPGDLLICINGKKIEYGVYIGTCNENGYRHICYWPWGNPGIESSIECESELKEFRETFLEKHK